MPIRALARSRWKGVSRAGVWDRVFAVTAFLAILAGALILSWYLQKPAVKQFPDTIELRYADFMSSIPSGVAHFRMLNITEIVTKSGGRELIGGVALVSLLSPLINVTSGEVKWAVDIEDEQGAVVNVLGMDNNAATRLADLLNQSALSTEEIAGFRTYRVWTANKTWALMAMVDRVLVYFEESTATGPMKRVLGAMSANETRMFDDDAVKRAYYLATLEAPLLGVSLTEFTSLPVTGVEVNWMFSFARYDGSNIDRTDVFELNSQQAAIDKFDKAKPLYFINAQSQYIIGSFIVAGHVYPLEDLRTVILSL